jgi:hypothetical protein
VGGVRSKGPEGDVAGACDCTAKHDIGVAITVQVGQGDVGGGVDTMEIVFSPYKKYSIDGM